MAAQQQCDQPHVRFEHPRSHPAKWEGDVSWSDAPRQTLAAIKQEDLGSPFTLHAPLPPLAPQQPIALPSIPEDYRTPSTSTITIDNMLMFNSPISTDQPPNSLLFQTSSYDDRITSLERSVCSNFVCCGEHLPDFHALIDHFEENHVSVVTTTGKRLYPPRGRSKQPAAASAPALTASTSRRPEPPKILTSFPSPSLSSATLDSTASTPASSRSSSVVSTPPMPTTPLSPPQSFHNDSAMIVSHDPPALEYNPYLGISVALAQESQVDTDPLSPYSVDVISAFGPEYDFSRDYACYESAFVEKQKKEEEESLLQLQFLQECLERDGFPLMDIDESALLQPQAGPSTEPLRDPTPPSRREPSASAESSVSHHGGRVSKAKYKASAPSPVGQSAGTGRKREKAYKCPHYGCTKAYLNPNGLKYHLEKGTCKFDESLMDSAPPPSAPKNETASQPSASTSSSSSRSSDYSTPSASSKSTSASSNHSYDYQQYPPTSKSETYSPSQAYQNLYGSYLEDSSAPSISASSSSSISTSSLSRSAHSASPSPSSSSPPTVPDVVSQSTQPQARLGQGSRFAAVYSHHLHPIYDGAPSSSSL